jgi:hypothetical protein
MAENPKASTRLRPTILLYLDDLSKTGAYGKGRAEIMRRFIENGITRALEAGVIRARDVRDHGETVGESEED